MSARFVFLADSHHHPTATKDWAAPKMLTESGRVLDAIVPAVNRLKPDFVLHGGDLVCGGGSFDMPSDVFERAVNEVELADDGTVRFVFHTLDLPDLLKASYDRSPPEANRRWAGQPHDRDTEIVVPRLRDIWSQ